MWRMRGGEGMGGEGKRGEERGERGKEEEAEYRKGQGRVSWQDWIHPSVLS